MKLTIELVPSTCWYNNLRKVLSKTEWDKIRKEVYTKASHRCEICGAYSKLNCHEIWQYDDKNLIQKLNGFIALCTNCHWIKHIGLAGILSNEGKLDYKKLIDHFMQVNNVSRKEFENHVKDAFDTWRKRSQKQWKTEFGDWDYLIKN